MAVVPVPLGDRSYKIHIGPGLISQLGAFCRKLDLGRRCAIISDRNVAPAYGSRCLAELQRAGFEPCLIAVPAGEKAKSLRHMETCYHQLAQHRLERRSFVVALGGGVIGDLAGFVAATYLRGIAFVQVPTTLLAQVDSSVGGKVGINLPAGKNLVGAFHQPKLVLCDLSTISSLPAREFRAGLAEVIKYGIIYDARLFRRLERDMDRILARETSLLSTIVARCCAIKADVVSQDETESGLRAILNFGHTLGHAIEAISGYGKFLHGEAISIGQIAAARLSARLTDLPQVDVDRIERLFARTGLPTRYKATRAQTERLLAAMKLDKKVSGGEIKFVLARRIGDVIWGQKIPEATVRDVIESLGD